MYTIVSIVTSYQLSRLLEVLQWAIGGGLETSDHTRLPMNVVTLVHQSLNKQNVTQVLENLLVRPGQNMMHEGVTRDETNNV